jgi:hypothetical protein
MRVSKICGKGGAAGFHIIAPPRTYGAQLHRLKMGTTRSPWRYFAVGRCGRHVDSCGRNRKDYYSGFRTKSSPNPPPTCPCEIFCGAPMRMTGVQQGGSLAGKLSIKVSSTRSSLFNRSQRLAVCTGFFIGPALASPLDQKQDRIGLSLSLRVRTYSNTHPRRQADARIPRLFSAPPMDWLAAPSAVPAH